MDIIQETAKRSQEAKANKDKTLGPAERNLKRVITLYSSTYQSPGIPVHDNCIQPIGMGGRAPVSARPQPMVAGGRVLGEDGQKRAMEGPIPIIEIEDQLARQEG
jgi:hypothetical protein